MGMNCWRRCCQLTIRDRVKNDVIRDKMGVDQDADVDIDIVGSVEWKRLNGMAW